MANKRNRNELSKDNMFYRNNYYRQKYNQYYRQNKESYFQKKKNFKIKLNKLPIKYTIEITNKLKKFKNKKNFIKYNILNIKKIQKEYR